MVPLSTEYTDQYF